MIPNWLTQSAGELAEALTQPSVQEIVVHSLLGVGPKEGAVIRAKVLQWQLQIPESAGQLCCTSGTAVAVVCVDVVVDTGTAAAATAVFVMRVLAVASVLTVSTSLGADLLHEDTAD